MTASVIVIFLAIALVWAIVGPTHIKETAQAPPKAPNKNYEEGEGPPNVVNHTPKRKKKELPPEEERTEALDTFKRLKAANSTVRFN